MDAGVVPEVLRSTEMTSAALAPHNSNLVSSTQFMGQVTQLFPATRDRTMHTLQNVHISPFLLLDHVAHFTHIRDLLFVLDLRTR